MTTAPTDGPVLILTASMGSGHSQVAHELAGRLSPWVDTRIVDLLEILPWRIGTALRAGYAAMLRDAPWLYELIYQSFFVPRSHWQPSTSPLVALAAARLRRLVNGCRPRAVVSTFHLAGQAAGWLRQRSQLGIPSIVVITEPAAHALWTHPGTDMFICPYPWVADDVKRATGKPALAPGPVVDRRFAASPLDVTATQLELALRPTERTVLISTGAWGVGDVHAAVDELSRVPGLHVVVLCGRNERLRRKLARRAGCQALGWRDDLPAVFACASVLVDNAGGSTCAEAFAAGLPVVAFRPIPGHGRAGVRALAQAGLVTDGRQALSTAVRGLCSAGPPRERQRRLAASVFRADPAEVLAVWLAAKGITLGALSGHDKAGRLSVDEDSLMVHVIREATLFRRLTAFPGRAPTEAVPDVQLQLR